MTTQGCTDTHLITLCNYSGWFRYLQNTHPERQVFSLLRKLVSFIHIWNTYFYTQPSRKYARICMGNCPVISCMNGLLLCNSISLFGGVKKMWKHWSLCWVRSLHICWSRFPFICLNRVEYIWDLKCTAELHYIMIGIKHISRPHFMKGKVDFARVYITLSSCSIHCGYSLNQLSQSFLRSTLKTTTTTTKRQKKYVW